MSNTITDVTNFDGLARVTTPTETWSTIDGYSNYLVSTLGRVFSIARKRAGKGGCSCKIQPKILKPATDKIGYQHYRLTADDGNTRLYKAHRLVAITYLNLDPASDLVVDHINADKTNNTLVNLQLLSRSANIIKANSKDWSFTTSDNETIHITNLSKFCRDYNATHTDNITITSMRSLHIGKIDEYKGFTRCV